MPWSVVLLALPNHAARLPKAFTPHLEGNGVDHLVDAELEVLIIIVGLHVGQVGRPHRIAEAANDPGAESRGTQQIAEKDLFGSVKNPVRDLLLKLNSHYLKEIKLCLSACSR